MGLTLAQKIIKNHIVSGEMTVGSEIGLKIDQTLTQDATGTMAYLEFEAMGVPRSRRSGALPISTTIPYRPALKMRTTTALFRASPRSTASGSPGRATASATRYIWSASAFRAKP